MARSLTQPTSPLTTPDEAGTVCERHRYRSSRHCAWLCAWSQRQIRLLRYGRLQAIRERVDTPLVLHGSSGVNDTDITQGIKPGLAKVNIDTHLEQSLHWRGCVSVGRR
ncbi:MAG: class II fructose-bisphosphate aldolase [Chloroflexi bacterium]|nr:class II fructose-bisphosphate aldolase [Chloroflexota bacterium]